jgi:hypothetical protein
MEPFLPPSRVQVREFFQGDENPQHSLEASLEQIFGRFFRECTMTDRTKRFSAVLGGAAGTPPGTGVADDLGRYFGRFSVQITSTPDAAWHGRVRFCSRQAEVRVAELEATPAFTCQEIERKAKALAIVRAGITPGGPQEDVVVKLDSTPTDKVAVLFAVESTDQKSLL